ncbi:hypothetical protein ACFQ8C_37085, partial [Streptomyces sp. NPDC056503]|uniref:hypothetical protein n=1 Tax=Streptomyces sp. NPDC056503 TaxID=3345842 RepID=UPI0036AB3F9C
ITVDVGRKLYRWLELGIDVKAEEESKRLQLIEQVKAIAARKPEAKKKVEEFEFKADIKLENFNIKLAEAALDRLAEFK